MESGFRLSRPAVYEIEVTTPSALGSDHRLSERISEFLRSWTDLARQDQSDMLAENVLIGTESSTAIISRDAFLAAVRARHTKIGGRSTSQLSTWTATGVGRGLLLVTATWVFDGAGADISLVSDFLLQDASGGGLRCAAYLPRQDVTAMLSSASERIGQP